MAMSEDKIDNLRGQIEDTEARIFATEEEVKKLDDQNQELRDVLEGLQSQVDELKNKTESTESDTKDVIKQQVSGEKVVFGKTRPGAPPSEFAAEVKGLREQSNNADSDED